MKDIPVTGLISIAFGVVILLVPNIVSYLLGVYLIIMGVMSVKKRS